MLITREMLIKRLSEASGYYQKDIRELMQCLDDVVFDALCEVTPDEEVLIQMVRGLKLQCMPVAERQRKDPRDQSDIICRPTCRVGAKFSEDIRLRLQQHYDDKYNK